MRLARSIQVRLRSEAGRRLILSAEASQLFRVPTPSAIKLVSSLALCHWTLWGVRRAREQKMLKITSHRFIFTRSDKAVEIAGGCARVSAVISPCHYSSRICGDDSTEESSTHDWRENRRGSKKTTAGSFYLRLISSPLLATDMRTRRFVLTSARTFATAAQ